MSDYNISADIQTVAVLHLGQPVTIQREQDPSATIRAEFALTARQCPPYCIQPATGSGRGNAGRTGSAGLSAAHSPGRAQTDGYRFAHPDWYAKGTIPARSTSPTRRTWQATPPTCPA